MSETQPLRVLLLEDDELMRRATARLLRGRGWEVHEAARLDEALAAGDNFDLAVLDLQIDKADSVALAETFMLEGRAARVVFYSGTEDEALLERARAVADVLGKQPAGSAGLLALLQELEKGGVA